MAGDTNGLRELHELHLQLRGVQEKLERGPKQLKARHLFTGQKQAEAEAQKEKLKQLKLKADQHGLQLKSNENKISDLRGKLNAAASNREFDIIKSQIEADTVANSVLEDEILDLLEKVDMAKVDLGRIEMELGTAKSEEARIATEIAAAEAGLKAEAARYETAINEAERALPEDVKIVYRRLVQAHGSAAFAQVDGNICSFCYVAVPPQMMVELKAGKIMFCNTCGRLMYLRPSA